MRAAKPSTPQTDQIEAAMREIERTLAKKLDAGAIEQPAERQSVALVREVLRMHLEQFAGGARVIDGPVRRAYHQNR